ncbi:Uncharacterised protein [Mycobacteroides abscessus]|uniref:HK97 gp10 family phage protein n=1 Tax=Mycobacteroides abscessus TaxID=36809 RepID=UPI0005E0126E|nr:Uncharacterised protein [Mycobacteroides abscessus]
MANPLSKFGISDSELAAAIASSAEVDAGLREMAQEAADYWRSVSPVDTGEYAASVKVQKVKNGKATVGSKHWRLTLSSSEPDPTQKTDQSSARIPPRQLSPPELKRQRITAAP